MQQISLKPRRPEEREEENESDRGSRSRKFIHRPTTALLIVALVAIGAAFYFYRENAAPAGDSQKTAQKEIERLISRVGEIIVLPEGEQPTVATVTNLEQLKDQPFFSKAKVGDKVLIYTNMRKAILYDPIQHKIIEVAPLNIGNQ